MNSGFRLQLYTTIFLYQSTVFFLALVFYFCYRLSFEATVKVKDHLALCCRQKKAGSKGTVAINVTLSIVTSKMLMLLLRKDSNKNSG